MKVFSPSLVQIAAVIRILQAKMGMNYKAQAEGVGGGAIFSMGENQKMKEK